MTNLLGRMAAGLALCAALGASGATIAQDDIVIKSPSKPHPQTQPRRDGDDIVIGKPKPAADSGVGLEDLPGRRYGLLVGVNDYTFFSDLTFCDADIHNLSGVLENSGFDARDLTVLRDGLKDHHLLPYRNNILTQLQNLLESVQPNDLVMVAFSGHGVHLDGKSYLCPADAQLDRAAETMIPLDQLYDMLNACPASQKLLIVDACRNDPTPAGTRSPAGIEQTNEFTRSLQQQAPPRGTMLFNSCAPNQYSVEDPDFKSGVFMHFVIAGLKGEADADKDAKVSLFELYRYAEYETKTFVRRTRNLVQTPVLRGEVAGVYELAVVGDASSQISKVDVVPATKPEAPMPAETKSAEPVKVAVVESVKPTLPDDAALTRAAVESNPLLQQGNRYFAEGKYNDAIYAFTNVINAEENKAVVREALKRRSAAYMALNPNDNVSKALADIQAAGLSTVSAPIRAADGRVMDAERVVARLQPGQVVQVKAINGTWLHVVSVDGNDSIYGWLDKKYLAEVKKPVMVAPPPPTVSNTHPMNPNNGGNRPFPGNRPPNNGQNGQNNAANQIIRDLQREVIRQILK